MHVHRIFNVLYGKFCTVAILAQGTSWAVAVTQALFSGDLRAPDLNCWRRNLIDMARTSVPNPCRATDPSICEAKLQISTPNNESQFKCGSNSDSQPNNDSVPRAAVAPVAENVCCAMDPDCHRAMALDGVGARPRGCPYVTMDPTPIRHELQPQACAWHSLCTHDDIHVVQDSNSSRCASHP